LTSVPVQDPVFGNPSFGSRFSHHQVKGSLLAARPRYVRDRWGDDGVQRVVDRLAPEIRSVLAAEILNTL
jgi:hypothetical protein